MNGRLALIWRWLRYQVRRVTPEIMDPAPRLRRRIRDRRDRVDRVVTRVAR